MSSKVPKEWLSLPYLDPAQVLVHFRRKEQDEAFMRDMSPRERTLRTRDSQPLQHMRQAALFCYGFSLKFSAEVGFTLLSEQNSEVDAAVRVLSHGQFHYVPVQLKEWVPEHLNRATLQEELAKLAKYGNAPELVVCFFLNRRATLSLNDLQLPASAQLGEIWFCGAADPTMTRWQLMAPRENGIEVFEFSYPSDEPG